MVASGLALHAAPAQPPGITRTDLPRHDRGVPGREVAPVRVNVAPGVGFPTQSHPGEAIVSSIEGVREDAVEGQPPVTRKAGEVLCIPAGTIHAARHVGKGNAAERATSVVATGTPLVVLVK